MNLNNMWPFNKQETVSLESDIDKIIKERDILKKDNIVLKEKINELKVLPRIVNEPFLESKGFWATIGSYFGKVTPLKQLEGNSLLLMKETGYYELIENVKAGEFIIEKEGIPVNKLLLTPEKRGTLKYNQQEFPLWVANEASATPYPEDPIFESNLFLRIVNKIVLNYKDKEIVDQSLNKGKMWLYIALGVAIVIAVAGGIQWKMGGGASLVNNATEVVSNITNIVVTDPSTVIKVG